MATMKRSSIIQPSTRRLAEELSDVLASRRLTGVTSANAVIVGTVNAIEPESLSIIALTRMYSLGVC